MTRAEFIQRACLTYAGFGSGPDACVESAEDLANALQKSKIAPWSAHERGSVECTCGAARIDPTLAHAEGCPRWVNNGGTVR